MILKSTMKDRFITFSPFLFLFLLLVLAPSVHAWSTTTSKTKSELTRRDTLASLSSSLQVPIALSFFLSQPANAEEGDSDEYITTPRGLKFKVTNPPNDPNSPTPKRAQKVKAKYTLYINDFPPTAENEKNKSTKIDSSKGLLGEKPLEFLAGVSQVIKGWDLAISDMRVGEARKLIIPSDLGYGDKGAGGKIPGGATLYFDVELVEIGDMAKLNEDQYKWLDEHPL